MPADEGLAGCTRDARLLFVMLITQADDEGRMRGATSFVRSCCLPYDDVSLEQVDEWLGELVAGGFVVRYAVDGQRYLWVAKFLKHQKIDKPRPSVLPATSSRFVEPSTNDRRPGADASATDRDMDREREREVEGERDGPPSSAVAADDDSIEECGYLADWIERNGSKRPTVTKAWLQAADRLKRLDGRTHAQVMTCIEWCQQDEFWRSNVLSMPKLREKYDQLRLSANRRAAQPSGSDVRRAIALGEDE